MHLFFGERSPFPFFKTSIFGIVGLTLLPFFFFVSRRFLIFLLFLLFFPFFFFFFC